MVCNHYKAVLMSLPNDPLPEVLKQLKQKYQNEIPEHLKELKQLIENVQKNVTLENLKALRLAIHKMSGSAGTYGYEEVSHICRQWDLEISQKIDAFPPDQQWLANLMISFKKVEEEFHGKK